jgi:metallo-beta-lactamase family protein
MCEAGRILHHLKAGVEDPRNTIAIVGFQAQHTLGRRLVERRPKVRIFGVERSLGAEVAVLNGFSAHADQPALLEFVEATRAAGPLRHVALVHGEPRAQDAFRKLLESRGVPGVVVPEPGETLTL